ncbi:uncharacterized protein LOC134184856 [Corticium candelabrum]|uniref:uncharacterized protein LOC134184856 n=1 Tax=Corticium candelabrum TaxID=121492 RepID=UPI002E3026CC|nr:uncharacterized protein LOC134184856 [Corticium candelabrum]
MDFSTTHLESIQVTKLAQRSEKLMKSMKAFRERIDKLKRRCENKNKLSKSLQEKPTKALDTSPAMSKRRTRTAERRIFTVDPDRLGAREEILLVETTSAFQVQQKPSKVYEIVAPPIGMESEVKESKVYDHTTFVLEETEKVLNTTRLEADNLSFSQYLGVDIWVHLGKQLIANVDKSEVSSAVPVRTLLTRVKRGDWKSRFEQLLRKQELLSLDQFLKLDAELKHSSTRYDIAFETPSKRKRRFKVWLNKDEPTNTSREEQIPGVFYPEETSPGLGSTALRVGCGILCSPYDSRLTADIALPGYPFDCRLLVKTGIADSSDRTPNEKKEDSILSETFLEKIRVINGNLLVPPKRRIPAEYKQLFHRKCERRTYKVNFGFELTVSKEREIHPKSRAPDKIDLHIHSTSCDDMLQQKQGRDWKPQDVLRCIPEMLKFTKDLHRYF